MELDPTHHDDPDAPFDSNEQTGMTGYFASALITLEEVSDALEMFGCEATSENILACLDLESRDGKPALN